MASSRRRRLRRRFTPRLPSIPKNPVAVATSLVTPRIGYRRTRRNAGPKVPPKIHYVHQRRKDKADRRSRTSRASPSPVLDDLDDFKPETSYRRKRCVRRPSPSYAAQKRWEKFRSGGKASTPAQRNETFKLWCK